MTVPVSMIVHAGCKAEGRTDGRTRSGKLGEPARCGIAPHVALDGRSDWPICGAERVFDSISEVRRDIGGACTHRNVGRVHRPLRHANRLGRRCLGKELLGLTPGRHREKRYVATVGSDVDPQTGRDARAPLACRRCRWPGPR